MQMRFWKFHISWWTISKSFLQSFETCVLVSSNLCGKLFLSLESTIAFDEYFKVTSGPFFMPNFNVFNVLILQIRQFCV